MKVDVAYKLNWSGDEVVKDMDEELMKSSMSTANRIVIAAKSKVGRSTRPITEKHPGHLQDTIRARAARKKKWKPGAFVFAGDRTQGIFWHYFVEYGTYDKSAHPFMRPAVDKNFNFMRAESEHAAKRAINKKQRGKTKHSANWGGAR